jgi:prevent-host-death family protein
MVMSQMTMTSAGDFKAKCLALMDDVQSSGGEIVITKRGHPVARLVSAAPRRPSGLFGRMSGSVRILGDLIAPIGDAWDAEEEI